jgi:flavodoxin/NAD-dependent dihydropyrimidine dehydrogenase PreA subunit
MKKGLIVFFSQKGSNMGVAEAIGAGLREAGHQVDLWNLKEGQPPDPRDYDFFGLGSPTYYYRPPFIVTDYVKSLPELAGLPAFVFVVHGTYRGDTGDQIRQALARKGAEEVGYFYCYGAGYFLGYLKEGYLFSAGHPTEEELARAGTFGREVAARLAGKPYPRAANDPPLEPIYRLERFLANRFLTRHFYSRLFRENERCRPDCDVCIKQCPVENIKRGADGRLVRGRGCQLCLSCEMTCPEDAITSPVSWPIFRPFILYNVRHGARDPMLDSARVVHKNGQTQRV